MREIDHVVCPIDRSFSSERALAQAFAWARWSGAMLHVVHVVPPPFKPAVHWRSVASELPLTGIRADLEREVERVRRPGVRFEIEVHCGVPAGRIIDEVMRRRKTLLVMGCRSPRGLERLMLGSVVERVLHGTRVPTLIVPATGPDTVKLVPTRITCAVDFLPSSLEALRFALSLSKEVHAELRLLNVVEDPDEFEEVTVRPLRSSEPQRLRDAVDDLRRHVPEEARRSCTIHEDVRRGDPVPLVGHVARQTDTDLLVVGAGDRYRFRSLWLGGTTDSLVRASSCPVLVVPPPPAVRRAAAMTSPPIARERWQAMLDRISRERQGDPTTVTLLDPALSALPEAHAMPLIGLVTDQRRATGIQVLLGDGEAHLMHVIEDPIEVRVDEVRTHRSLRVLITEATGRMTLIETMQGTPNATEHRPRMPVRA